MAFFNQHSNKIIEQAKELALLFKKILDENNREYLLNFIYEIIEEDLYNNTNSKNISCSKGCSFCCHDIIYLNKTEFEHLQQKIKSLKIKFNKRLSNIQNSKPFKELTWAEKQCKFLKNGECSIYEHRPIICRTHNSIDKVENCDRSKVDKTHQQQYSLITSAIPIALAILEGSYNPDDLIPIHKIK